MHQENLYFAKSNYYECLYISKFSVFTAQNKCLVKNSYVYKG
jgi:hypothetical protein